MNFKKLAALAVSGVAALMVAASPVAAAQQTINVGSSGGDGTGDPLRTAFQKANSNFSELYKLSNAVQAQSATVQAASTPATIIWDDDCANDVDCAFSQDAVHHWIDAGNVTVLAFIADSSNAYSAPLFKIWENYYGHTTIPIGAYQGSGVATGSASTWPSTVVSQLDAGDTRTNYTDCVTVYRQALAAAANSSVKIVVTGFATCLVPLLQSPADGISSMTGAQLVQAKVSGLYIMGGDYPTGSEFNFTSDPADWSTVFTTWTTQNGYSPVYLNGHTPGNSVISGAPSWFPSTHPAVVAGNAASHGNRPSWDSLSLYQAIFGTSAFTISANGTNTVNSSTGANTWSSSTASGHYYLTLTSAVTVYEALLDGQNYAGANWWLPFNSALNSPNLQCSSITLTCAWGSGALYAYGIPNFYNGMNAYAGDGQYATAGQFLAPSLANGHNVEVEVGVSASANNRASVSFHLTGSGSTSNYVRIGFYGQNDAFRIYPTGAIQLPLGYTVATLPTCNSGMEGAEAWVTDAASPAYLSALTGGGSTVAPAFCNGSAWVGH